MVLVTLIHLGLVFPLWYAAYHQFGLWPCVALFATQVAVEAAKRAGGK